MRNDDGDDSGRPLQIASSTTKLRKVALIGAGWGAFLGALPVVVTRNPQLCNLLLFGSCGALLGSCAGMAFWATRQKRRLSLFVLVPSWGFVCAIGSVLVFLIPATIFYYLSDGRITHLDHSPNSIPKQPGLGLILSTLLSPLGFLFGMILAFFKLPPKENAADDTRFRAGDPQL